MPLWWCESELCRFSLCSIVNYTLVHAHTIWFWRSVVFSAFIFLFLFLIPSSHSLCTFLVCDCQKMVASLDGCFCCGFGLSYGSLMFSCLGEPLPITRNCLPCSPPWAYRFFVGHHRSFMLVCFIFFVCSFHRKIQYKKKKTRTRFVLWSAKLNGEENERRIGYVHITYNLWYLFVLYIT